MCWLFFCPYIGLRTLAYLWHGSKLSLSYWQKNNLNQTNNCCYSLHTLLHSLPKIDIRTAGLRYYDSLLHESLYLSHCTCTVDVIFLVTAVGMQNWLMGDILILNIFYMYTIDFFVHCAAVNKNYRFLGYIHTCTTIRQCTSIPLHFFFYYGDYRQHWL